MAERLFQGPNNQAESEEGRKTHSPEGFPPAPLAELSWCPNAALTQFAVPSAGDWLVILFFK